MKTCSPRAFLFTVILLLPFVVQAGNEDFTLNDLNGKSHSVSDYRGKWIVMNFWATWCPPCIHEMPELESFYKKNQERATVWGVTFEETDPELIGDFIKDLNVSYPILGQGADPRTPYGQIRVLPTTLFIDPHGK
ncbi:MAG: TlpA disulfide reductase family protein, partial [Pseudomonadota bacterium]